MPMSALQALCRARGYAAGGVVGAGLWRARLRLGGIISGLAVVIFVPGVWSRCPIDQTGGRHGLS